MSIERRMSVGSVEVRREGKAATVRGYAALYDTEVIIAGLFRERIAPGAFDVVLASNPDVVALFNHDENMPLGRTAAGTLKLFTDERGLGYEFTPNPDDTDAMNVLARIRRGDVRGSSYGFCAEDAWTPPARAGELPLRTIVGFEMLRDVSPVTFPAFEDTTAEARSAALAHQPRVVDVPAPTPTEHVPNAAFWRAEVDVLEEVA